MLQGPRNDCPISPDPKIVKRIKFSLNILFWQWWIQIKEVKILYSCINSVFQPRHCSSTGKEKSLQTNHRKKASSSASNSAGMPGPFHRSHSNRFSISQPCENKSLMQGTWMKKKNSWHISDIRNRWWVKLVTLKMWLTELYFRRPLYCNSETL